MGVCGEVMKATLPLLQRQRRSCSPCQGTRLGCLWQCAEGSAACAAEAAKPMQHDDVVGEEVGPQRG